MSFAEESHRPSVTAGFVVLLIAFLAVSPAIAATTWVIDCTGGPTVGTYSTAVYAAPDSSCGSQIGLCGSAPQTGGSGVSCSTITSNLHASIVAGCAAEGIILTNVPGPGGATAREIATSSTVSFEICSGVSPSGSLIPSTPTPFDTGSSTFVEGSKTTALIFDYRADWYELDGNTWGSQDGNADIRDDFDDGVVPPPPYTAGTVVEDEDGNGLLSLRNPGNKSVDPSVSVTWEVSSETVNAATSGSGDFTATASWSPIAPQPDHFYGLFLGNATPITDPNHSNYSIQIGRGGPSLASIFGVTENAFAFTIRHLRVVGGTVQDDVFETAYINWADVTQNILLRLDYDDSTKQVTGSYSLDGGSNFLSPFSSGTMNAATLYTITLISDPLTLNESELVPSLSLPGLAAFVILLGVLALRVRRRRQGTMCG